MLINLRNALMAGKRLPYDAEVEYLESTGTQWIDTGIAHTGACKWECDAAITQTNLVNRHLGQTYDTVVSSPRFAFGIASSGLWYCGIGNLNSAVSARADNNRHSFVVDAPNKGFYIDGSKVYTMSWTSFALPSVVYGGLALFGRKFLDTGAISPFVAMRIYSSKHYDSDILVRDYIPVRKGTVGYLYDRVSGKLFGNEGTGDFVLGPDVVPVEYIESHGTEWIDTGFKADNTCKFRIDMERRGGSDYWLFGSRTGTSTATDKSCLFASVSSSIGYAMMGSAVPSFNSALIKDGKHMIEMSLAGGLVIDGDVSATYTASEQAEVFTNSYPMSIFTMYNGSSYFNAFAGRVYLFSITSGGVSRLNLLPVRVGTDATSWEGAMMDVLTRRIYRNQGTGAFGYGNDLKYPIPAE